MVKKLKSGLDAFSKDAMFWSLKLAAELIGAFPATKQINVDFGGEVCSTIPRLG